MKKIDSDTTLNIIGKVFMGLGLIYGLYKGYEFFIVNPAKYKTKAKDDCYTQYLFTGSDINKIPDVNGYVYCLKGSDLTVTAATIREECLQEASAENRVYCKPNSGVECSSVNDWYLNCVRSEGLGN